MNRIWPISKDSNFEKSKDKKALLVDKLNWSDFPYLPKTQVFLAWNAQGLFLNFKVKEQQVKTTVETFQGRVNQDSCVEFFCSLDAGKTYYNFEWNATGTLYLAYRASDGSFKKYFTDRELQTIETKTSLPSYTLLDKEETEWSLEVKIPPSILGLSKYREGQIISANFYKCGDGLEVPHYVSAFLIETDWPSFHEPNYFESFVLTQEETVIIV